MSKLYFGGPILPMSYQGCVDALLVHNGRIAACGPLRDLEPLAKGAQRIDLQGKALLPAFIDSHSHITALAQTIGLCSLEGCSDIAQLYQRIEQYAAEHKTPPGQWITAFGYDHNFLKERRHPTALDLDKAAPHNPLIIGHASGHMGVLNTMAMRELGISASTPDPQGGKLRRIPGSNQPDGYAEETAFTSLSSRIPQSGGDPLDKIVKAQEIYLKMGVTTIHDGLTAAPQWELLQRAGEKKLLKADIISYIDIKSSGFLVKEHKKYKSYVNRLRIGGYKLFLDGSPQGRTAWMTEPYINGERDYRGYPIYSDSRVTEYLSRTQRENMQIAVHCNGDAACLQMMRCYSRALGEYGRALRPLMIHAQLLPAHMMGEIKRLGIVPSFFVAHVYHWGDIHIENLGMERAKNISPAKSALEQGVIFSFHQDSPVIPPNMTETIWCAVNRITKNGAVLGSHQRLTPYQALRAVTADAAYAVFEEKEKGTLTPGKLADLVILDKNPLTCPPEKLGEIKVLETIKEGNTVYKGL